MKNTNTPEFFEKKAEDFLIVGIGASAGGVEALKEFFRNVPNDSGMAYVVILHLSPNHDSQLALVLQVVTAIPVVQVTGKVAIKPDNIYVVSPNHHLTLEDGFIVSSQNINTEERRAPVDIFFRNLAETHGPRAVAVILSGTGANGSMGLKRIKELGGVAYVQNPREAEFNEMPRNSIATELVDEVLPVAEIPRAIVTYRNNIGAVQITIEAEKRPEQQQQALREVFTQLRVRTGHDFSNYKRPTLLRRIERRINVRNLPDLPSYAAFLHQNHDEVHALLKDLLISVTNFFRDKKPFETLERNILPAIFKSKKSDSEIRVWVSGCATGEEAYSIAMLLAERTAGAIDAPKVQIFATDIDEAAIATAREGLYTLNDVADVSSERLTRFFNKVGEGYRVRRELREIILFATHNFLKDPPFSRLDLISCRNVLIYLNATAQERVMETFHFALKPAGFLFLGTSEFVEGAGDLYATISRENHIYQAREVEVHNYPVPESVPVFLTQKNEPQPLDQDDKQSRTHTRVSFGELHHRLLEQYAPPSVVINENYDIVHMSEKVGKFFEISGGEPTQNLLKLVRPELRIELRSALYQAVKRNVPVETRNIVWEGNGERHAVNLHVRPATKDGDSAKGMILVIFDPNHEVQEDEIAVMASDEPVARQLEEELIHVKSQLRSSIEQHEYQAEELKASNEELQAMNEELRSAAEELETSQEELQSINEELRTVNQELKVKIEEISVTSSNLQNLINSADVATLFLDRGFCTRLYTPAALQIFNLIPADYGRPIFDISHRLEYDHLLNDVQTVLEKFTIIEREVTTTDHSTFIMRILPYRTSEDRISGVVVTFFDITKRRQAESALQLSEQRMRLLIESAKEYAIFTFDTDRKVLSWSSGAQMIFGYTQQEITGQMADVVFVPEDQARQVPEEEVETAYKKGIAVNERWHIRKDGSRFWGSGATQPLNDEQGKTVGFVKIMRDLTEMRRLEETKFFLAAIVETSSDSVITIDFQRNITSWNKAAEKLYGYTAKEVVGRKLTTLTLPEGFLEILNKVDAIEHSREASVFETVKHDNEGEPKYLEIVMSPVLNTLGEVIGISTVARDVSERKRREANLAFLANMNLDFAPSSSVHEVMEAMGEHLAGYLRLSSCHFALIDEEHDRLEVVYEHRRDKNLPGIKGVHRISDNLTRERQRLYSGGKLAVINADGDSQRVKSASPMLKQFGLGALVDVPHLEGGQWKFLLTVGRADVGEWKTDELELLQELASKIYIRIERARAEEALRRSEEGLRTLTDAVPQIIWTNNEDSRANYFNQRWYEYTGLTYEESEGLGWQAIIHPNDEQASVEKWNKALALGEVFDTEYRLRRHDGTYCWFIGRNVPLKDNSGKITTWFGSATDIENLKKTEEALSQSEEQLRITMESASDYAIITMDTERKVQRWSKGAIQLFGYSETEMTGQSADIIYTEEDRTEGAPEKEMQTARDTGRAADERWHRRKDGSRFYVSGVMRPIQNNELMGYVKVMRDMTQQQLFTEELHRLVAERTAELQRSNEDLRRFAHVASHDLKEPVRKISTFTNRLKDEFEGVLPGKARSYLEKIITSTDRMFAMIEGVLTYSMLEKADDTIASVDLNKLLDEIELLLEIMISKKNATIKRTKLPILKGNPTHIFQLFFNLITNALKFSKAEEPSRIEITSEVVKQAEQVFNAISVSDNGIGFEQEFSHLIFQRFSRLNPVDEYEGTGLGLALCKNIVERHGGRISASGELNKGAVFTILWPVH